MSIHKENNTILLDTWRGQKPSIEYKALIGYAGISIKNENINTLNILDLTRAYIEKSAEESCGQCFPCRTGLKKIARRLNALCDGISASDDIEFLSSQAKKVMLSARCDIGQTSTKALLDILEKSPQLLQAKKTKRQEYLSLVTAPCTNACPAHVDIPFYIEKIKSGDFTQGLEQVMKKCPMPGTIGRVCERPCEKACKRALNAPPLSIRNLKRFLFDTNLNDTNKVDQYLENNPASKQKVAIIGAGPAGLSCAYYLAQKDYAVHIFEKEEKGGGMAKYGIPDYRLPADILQVELDKIQALGVQIHYGIEIGKNMQVTEFKKQDFKALFISTGSPKAPALHCEGEEECKEGLVSGIHYLNAATKNIFLLPKSEDKNKSILVVGGGNVAIDCVRTALRQGFEDVQLIYRRTEEEMPADALEIHEAKIEGVHFNFLIAPKKIIHENSKVTALVCQKMQLGEADSSGRRSPIAIEGEEVTFACQAIISAIGQKTDLSYIFEEFAKQGEIDIINKYNNLLADDITGEVSTKMDFLPLFGGGDCVTGPKSLIAALGAGRRSALTIDKKLQAKKETQSKPFDLNTLHFEQSLQKISLLSPEEDLPLVDIKKAMQIHTLPIHERLNSFDEVELSPAEWEARQEAERCLRCIRIIMLAQ